ncbi:hypothetical protein VPH35_033697 [Triticum aestivum]
MEDWISDVEEVKLLEDVKKKMEDGVVEAPDWLPDGWIMEVRRGDDGALYQYFISPVSGAKFTMKSKVLDYLFSEMDEHYIEANYSVADSMLSKSHEWLPKGWLVEIRAGGENMDKMYKFYVSAAMGVRLFSKEDVLLYVKEGKISSCDINGQCDTNSRDNILAEVEFNPSELPHGWVKELEYRKTLERTRKDQHESFRKRLMKNVMTNTSQASPSIPRRLKIGKNINLNERNFSVYGDNNTSTNLDSPDENQKIKKKSMKANGKEAYSSKTIRRPTGRPSEVATQTDGDIYVE